MLTALAPSLQSLPPQLELRDADRVVGWIEGDVVRFRGFDSQRGAAQAAAVAHQAMLRRLARGSRATPSANESDLSTVRRAADDAIARANGRPVASVLRSFVDGLRSADRGDFAFEIRVPEPIDELRMRGMAYVMYRALRSSGVAWPLLRRASPAEELATAPARAAEAAPESTGQRIGGGASGLQRLLERASRAWTSPWTRPQRVG
jgi:hypothetical protein